MTAANTTAAIPWEAHLLLFGQKGKKKKCFLVCRRILVSSLCVPEMKKIENLCTKITEMMSLATMK